tara:strand:- start:619 stop:1443 length:825 start_codon:yes stop_codon:yes gene_type:complete
MKIKSNISVFQGRHVKEGKKNIQVFPKKSWVKDLELIKKNNFNFFNWILSEEMYLNPLITEKLKVKKILKKLNLAILTICCDYFMSNPILKNKKKSLKILKKIAISCKYLGVKYIEIPFFKKNILESKDQIKELSQFLNSILNKRDLKNIIFCIESNLTLENYIYFMKNIKYKKFVKIIYDTGNSFKIDQNKNFAKEAEVLKKYLKFIHIKDANSKSWTVRLGKGEVNFKRIFKILKKNSYNDYFVLQTARANNDVNEIKRNVKFLKQFGYSFK